VSKSIRIDAPKQSLVTSPSAVARAARSPGRALWPVRMGYTLLGVGLLIGAWQLAIVVWDVKPWVAPSPRAVLQSLIDDRATLWRHVQPTAIESLLGFIVGNLASVALAALFTHSTVAERMFFPLTVALRTIPVMAVAPILVLIFGYGYAPKIVIAALLTFFPTLVNMVQGFRAVSHQHVELFHVLSARRWEVFLRLRVFTALPYFFASMRIAAPAAVIGAIVAEWIGSRQGLGYLIVNTTQNFRTPLLYSTILVSSAVALLFMGAVALLARLTRRWHQNQS
jgi:NitT/TauT family transport system permease protein